MASSRVGLAIASMAMTMLAVNNGCTASARDGTAGRPVPAQFAKACGHPGATVIVTVVPVTVARAQCNLTGVMIRYRLAGATVPTSGRAHEDVDTTTGYSVTGGNSITIDIDPKSGDVTISS